MNADAAMMLATNGAESPTLSRSNSSSRRTSIDSERSVDENTDKWADVIVAHPKPSDESLHRIAFHLGLPPQEVKPWFLRHTNALHAALIEQCAADEGPDLGKRFAQCIRAVRHAEVHAVALPPGVIPFVSAPSLPSCDS